MIMIFCNTFLYLLQLSEITGSFRGQVFPALKFLGYSLAGVIGLIGAIRIYNLWNVNGRHHVHIDAQVIGWISACIFLLLAMMLVDWIF